MLTDVHGYPRTQTLLHINTLWLRLSVRMTTIEQQYSTTCVSGVTTRKNRSFLWALLIRMYSCHVILRQKRLFREIWNGSARNLQFTAGL